MLAYRLFKRQFSATPMSGEGARLFGGRWNSKGNDMVYAADSLPLATMEVFVHVPGYREIIDAYCWVEIRVPDALVEALPPGDLPPGWNILDNQEAKHMGDTWLASQRSAGLLVPGVVVPRGSVLLINPRHPRIGDIQCSGPHDCSFDKRLAE